MSDLLPLSYVLPLKWIGESDRAELSRYLERLKNLVAEVIVVDGSEPGDFAVNAATWRPFVRHMSPDTGLSFTNGKVLGATIGIWAAGYEKIIVADDDVRYDRNALSRLVNLLDHADLVRPQNHFRRPMPWHAHWDTARTLLNRAAGADYPGTLALRRSLFLAMGGYDGNVLFENLELIRTVERNGGRVESPLDLYVERLAPTRARFFSQRVRQAYDDFALPFRMAVWLAVVPVVLWVAWNRRWRSATWLAGAAVAFAETGRRRASGRAVFAAHASLLAPVWVLERGVCAWLAVLCRLRGGVTYGDARIKKAANPP
ncbi:MAG: glycosyltransferase family 2 protein [Actinobacteria bacterium]|nr:glycosyltransferase family 2 protein [Actinomycetota bacterium]MDQ3533551.1 glycosyltransferase family 2 protein [Actinomycetota bacterium]